MFGHGDVCNILPDAAGNHWINRYICISTKSVVYMAVTMGFPSVTIVLGVMPNKRADRLQAKFENGELVLNDTSGS